jgi:hypothetical protein
MASLLSRSILAITASSLKSQEYKFQQETPTGRWSWVTVMDVAGSIPAFRVERIVSPFGILRDSIPIPGVIVESMAASITEIHTQFPPSILIGPPSSLIFNVDEGMGYSEPQEVVLTNNGVFGSLLGSTLASSAAFVSVTPAEIGNLTSNESGRFEVSIDGSQLLSINGPFTEMITVVDPRAVNTPQVLPITINVRPKSTIGVTPPTLTFNAIKPLTGDFPAIPSQTFVVSNVGVAGSVLNWQAQKLGCVDWLAGFFPVSGALNSGASETVTVSIQPPSNTMRGTFTETIRVKGYSQNQFVDVSIQLVVS